MTDTTGDALLAAILDNPEEDSVRLVYADWLDERAGVLRCHICGGQGGWMSQYSRPPVWCVCATCEGSGLEPDARGCRARGIRWMVKNPKNGWVCLCNNERTRCNPCQWMGDEIAGIPRRADGETHYVVQRGFVNEIRVTAEDFEACAADVFRRYPIEAVKLVGKSPLERIPQGQADSEREYGWLREVPGGATPHMLPVDIYDQLEGGYHWAGRHWRIYPSLTTAFDALSRACCVVGRRRARKAREAVAA